MAVPALKQTWVTEIHDAHMKKAEFTWFDLIPLKNALPSDNLMQDGRSAVEKTQSDFSRCFQVQNRAARSLSHQKKPA